MASNFNDPINILDSSNATGIGSGGSLNLRGGASIGKDLYIGGNVNISGTTTAFSDNIILINQNPSSSSDTGFLFQRYSSDITNNKTYSGIIYSEVNDEYILGYFENDANRGNITPNGFIGIQSQNLKLNSTENAIGLASGGGLTILGGTSISKDLYVGGDIKFEGNLYNNGDLFQSNSGSSYWVQSGSNIFYTNGNVSIGTTTSSQTLDVNGSANITVGITTGVLQTTNINSTNITTGVLNVSSNLNANSNSNTLGNLFTTGGNIGIGFTSPSYKLHVNGDVYATGNVITFSDERLKTDVVTIENSLMKVSNLRGVEYKMLNSNDKSIGVIAQEVEKICPELVISNDKYKGVCYGNMVGLLIEAIKDLNTKVEYEKQLYSQSKNEYEKLKIEFDILKQFLQNKYPNDFN